MPDNILYIPFMLVAFIAVTYTVSILQFHKHALKSKSNNEKYRLNRTHFIQMFSIVSATIAIVAYVFVANGLEKYYIAAFVSAVLAVTGIVFTHIYVTAIRGVGIMNHIKTGSLIWVLPTILNIVVVARRLLL